MMPGGASAAPNARDNGRPVVSIVHVDLFYGAVHSPPLTSLVRSLPDFRFRIFTNRPPEGHALGSWPENVSFVWRPPSWLDAVSGKLPAKFGRLLGIFVEVVKGLQYRRLVRADPGDLVHVQMGLEVDSLLRAGAKTHVAAFWTIARWLNDFRSSGTPVLFTEHSLFSRRSEFGFPNPLHEGDMVIAGAFSNVICVDRDSYDYLARRDEAAGIARRRWFVPNGIDTNRFAFQPPNDGNVLWVGYAGRLFRGGESQDFLARVARRLPEDVGLRLAVASSMTESEIRERWFGGCPMVIRRNIPNDEMPAFYGSIDLLVNPYLWGGVGRNSLEAMSCGRPVAMFDNADRYPVTKESGYLIPSEDVGGFLALLDRLRHNRGELAARGRKARSVIEGEFSQPVIARATEVIYRTLLSESHPGGRT